MDSWVFSFITACLLSVLWPQLPAVWCLPILAAFSIVLARMPHGLIGSGLVAGCLWMASVGHWTLHWQLPQPEISQIHQVKGRVTSLVRHDQNVRFYFLADRVNDKRIWPRVSMRLNWQTPTTQLRQGQTLSLHVKLKPPHGLANESGFNYKKFLVANNVVATGYVTRKGGEVISSATRLRQTLQTQLYQLPLQNLPWIAALSLGDRSAFASEDWSLVQRTGLAHLVAISGLHLAVVAGFVFAGFRLGCQSLSCVWDGAQGHNYQVIGFGLSVVFCFLYAYLAGFGLPVIRAWVILLLTFVLVTCRHNWRATQILLYTVFIVVLGFPLSLLSLSFWLSFAAVLSILFLCWRWPNHAVGGRLWRYWRGLLQLQLGLSGLLMPLVAKHFLMVPILSPLINLLAVPVVTLFVVPLCLVAIVLLMVAPTVSHYLFLLVDQFLSLTLPLLQRVADTSFTYLPLHKVPGTSWIGCILLVLMLLLPRLPFPRKWLILLVVPLVSHGFVAQKDGWSMDVLDVGQGLAVLLQQGDDVILYDVGARYPSGFNMADRVILPILRARGIDQPKGVIISHYDNDHSGGLDALVNHFPGLKVLDSNQWCIQGREQLWGKLTLTVLWPKPNTTANRNDTSCVVLLSDGVNRVLLPGDISHSVESALVRRYQTRLKANVLVAPHHGSNSSSSLPFINHVSPQYVVYSQGFRNRWDFPRQEVVNRYASIDARQLATSEHGQIRFVFHENEEIQLLHYHQDFEPYWYNR